LSGYHPRVLERTSPASGGSSRIQRVHGETVTMKRDKDYPFSKLDGTVRIIGFQ